MSADTIFEPTKNSAAKSARLRINKKIKNLLHITDYVYLHRRLQTIIYTLFFNIESY